MLHLLYFPMYSTLHYEYLRMHSLSPVPRQGLASYVDAVHLVQAGK